MNEAQKLWWDQAKSDLQLFKQLRRLGAHECHLLHYLQMSTEKISKAYLWRSGRVPPKSHTGFIRFLKALLDRPIGDLTRIAKLLGFGRPHDLDNWVTSSQQLAYSLQNIAPAESKNGPNPEYPCPHEAPINCPASHRFVLWNELLNTGQGRKLLQFIEHAVDRFDQFA